MNETLADIEVLTLRCRSDQSKTYISEAVLCYRSGAYRAAIVSVWIAVIFDLIDKIRELSLAGEPEAVLIYQQYEQYILQIERGNAQGVKQALEFERDLISVCQTKLKFFDQQQIVDLERLRQDRHRCAHPSFNRTSEPYRPSAEQARLHLTNAVTYVLSQPPTQGKAQLARLHTLVSSTYFPQDVVMAVTQLRASAFDRANNALINGFVDMVVFDYFKTDNNLYLKPQAIYALQAALEIHRSIVEPRIARQFNRVIQDASDAEIAHAIIFVAGGANSWSMLQQPAKDRIEIFLRTHPIPLILPTLSKVAHIPELDSIIREKFSALGIDDLNVACAGFGLARFIKPRAMVLLSEVRSFVAANDVINRVIFPIFEQLTREDFETIIRFPSTTGADLPGATAYTTLLQRIITPGLFSREELRALLRESHSESLV